MKTYLVGGAVRDQLLGQTIKERDWLVVGASPEIMLNKNYKQVGKDFPVFLHPITQEEYALARTEKKIGVGYYGFGCDFNQSVSLEDDLARRDLTINAMAIDDNGTLIDPFQGKKDLDNRILRHVSDAFIEDPVRVLRLARFSARFYHLGFRIASDTLSLMKKMVANGELEHLVKERIWQEWSRSLAEKNPEIFICTLRSCGALRVILPEIDALFGVPSSVHHHPEIDSGVHTLMVIRESANISTDLDVRFAATVHDLGKAVVSMNHWPRQPDHGELGIEKMEFLCKRLSIPNKFRQLAISVSKLHINIHRVFELSSEQIVETLEAADAFRRADMFEKLLLVCESDYLGRGLKGGYPKISWYFPQYANTTGFTEYTQANCWRTILSACNKIKLDKSIYSEYKGQEIKLELRKLRVACVDGINKKLGAL
ncbi:MAG: multifunctional CCA addition/repair protein [Legionellaceae bacterium]|nr:multifunctional CCA addition/repair protein [Legionellaceae bacterium]